MVQDQVLAPRQALSQRIVIMIQYYIHYSIQRVLGRLLIHNTYNLGRSCSLMQEQMTSTTHTNTTFITISTLDMGVTQGLQLVLTMYYRQLQAVVITLQTLFLVDLGQVRSRTHQVR